MVRRGWSRLLSVGVVLIAAGWGLDNECGGQTDGVALALPTGGGQEVEFCAVSLAPAGGSGAERRWWAGGDPVAGAAREAVLGAAFMGAGGGRLYYLGRHEVTRAQWAVVMGEKPPGGQEARLPKTRVSWWEVQGFLGRYNAFLAARGWEGVPRTPEGKVGVVRLPSEAEWEFAARGGAAVSEAEFLARTPYGEALDRHEWHGGNSGSRLHPVGGKAPNPIGLCDMLGNARELVGEPYRIVMGWGPVGGMTLRGGDGLTERGDVAVHRRAELGWRERSLRVGFRLAIGANEVAPSFGTGGSGVEAAAEPDREGLESVDLGRMLDVGEGDGAMPERVVVSLLPRQGETMGFRAVRVVGGTTMFRCSDSTVAGGMTGERSAWLGGAFRDARDAQGWVYYLAETELTRGQWAAVMGEVRPGEKEMALPRTELSWYEVQGFLGRYNGFLAEQPGGAGLPKTRAGDVGVVRLPTEAEWEYAARGGVEARPDVFLAGRAYVLEDTDLYEAASRSGVVGVERVGMRRANALGLYDMLGNASEMVLDGFRVAPWVGAMGGVVARGGNVSQDESDKLNAAIRFERPLMDQPARKEARAGYVGVRLAIGRPWLLSPGPEAPPDEVRWMQEEVGEGVPSGRGIPLGWRWVLVIAAGAGGLGWLMWRGVRISRRRGLFEQHPVAAPTVGVFEAADQAGMEVTNGIGMKLCWVPPTGPDGFLMGSPRGEAGGESDEAQHRVVLTLGCWMGKYEVTQGEYERVMARNPSHFKKVGSGAPVERVSWNKARTFCRKLTKLERAAGGLPEGWEYRLPTEAQWEYACRAGTTAAYGGEIDEMGWCGGNSGGTTHAVGGKRPNAWGLHDMHGNVWEWCGDWYGPYGAAAVTDPTGPARGWVRVIRGGGWYGNPQSCRSARRLRVEPGFRIYFLGFRVAAVRVAPQTSSTAVLTGSAEVRSEISGAQKQRKPPAPGSAILRRWLVRCAWLLGMVLGLGIVRVSILVRQQWQGMEERLPEKAVVSGETKPGKEMVNGIGMKLVWCPPGEFMMGSPQGEPGRGSDEVQHWVVLTQGFWLGKYEVTQAEYARVMGSSPSYFKNAGSRAPVENVSWEEAVEFCNKLTKKERATGRLAQGWEYRLPSEGQWEYGCRAGSTCALNNGKALTSAMGRCPNLDEVGWYEGNSGSTTHPVGLKAANAWGLHDMHGNVREWCADSYGPYDASATTDPTGPATGSYRVDRGGSWSRNAQNCQAAFRNWHAPGLRHYSLGFRVAEVPSVHEVKTDIERGAGREVRGEGRAALERPGATASPVVFGERAELGKSFRNGAGMGMVWIRPGTFRMGSENGDDDEKPVHEVTLSQGFWLGESEITQKQWRELIGSNPSALAGDDESPVECANWEEAMAFSKMLSTKERAEGKLPAGYEYMLPTEAQWEYACRAGTEGRYAGDLDAMAWYQNNSSGKTHSVKGKAPNTWGLYDMHGNVCEWCADWHGRYGDVALTDPTGSSRGSYRVVRGGDANSVARSCCSAVRAACSPGGWNSRTGFRVAAVPQRMRSGIFGSQVNAGGESEAEASPVVFGESAEEGRSFRNAAGMGMVWIPLGAFRMGSENGDNDEKPVRVVTLSCGYWLGESEVTQGQWLRLIGNNPSGFTGDENRPVEQVSWDDAVAFCKKLTQTERAAGKLPAGHEYGLPTEAQWEYACRAVTEGDYSGDLEKIAWYDTNSADETHPVKGRKPNAWGLYDMHGNVWEWCADWYGPYDMTAVTDPTGSLTGAVRASHAGGWYNAASGPCRVARGGGWLSGARYCRSAFRFWHGPGTRFNLLGFRAALKSVRRQSRTQPDAGKAQASETPSSLGVRGEGQRGGEEMENGIGMKLCWCPAGEFVMGSPRGEEGRDADEVQHRVQLTKGFWLGKDEVTQGEWKKVMGLGLLDQARKALADDTQYMLGGKKQTIREFLGRAKDDADPVGVVGVEDEGVPIYKVSWEEAVAFCGNLTERERAAGKLPEGWEYRLPTEAQWEYACRAGSEEATYAGPMRILGQRNAPVLDEIGWYAGNSTVGYEGRGWDTSGWKETQYPGGRAGPRRVGQKRANALGLHDMIGNVWEWCGDWYGEYSPLAVTDPTGPIAGSFRVLRGGGWSFDARHCRSAIRNGFEPGFRNYFLGFRVAAVPQPEAGRPSVPEVKTGGERGAGREVRGEGRAALERPGATASPVVFGERAELGKSFRNGAGMGMVWIRAGTSRMGLENGDDDEKPVHTVKLSKGFWLGETEVTQGQWREVMVMESDASNFKGDDLPVEKVSWDEASGFCRKLTEKERGAGRLPAGYEYALPTEAQWEYACRGGTEGDYGGDLDAMGWYSSNSGSKTHPVKGKKPNAWGLYDMHGNVWEWCADFYFLAPPDPAGPAATGLYRVLRGGGWYDGSRYCRSACRDGHSPESRFSNLGFRVAAVAATNKLSEQAEPASQGVGTAGAGLLHERWETLYLMGRKVGHGHVVSTREGFGPSAMYRSEISQEFSVMRGGEVAMLETRSRFLEDPETGRVESFETEQRQDKPGIAISGRVEGDTMKLKVNGRDINCLYPAGAVGPFTAEQRVREKGLNPGTVVEFDMFNDRDPRTPLRYRNEVIRRGVVDAGGKEVEAVRCDVQHNLFPDMKIVVWLDDKGFPVVVENPMGAMGTMRVVTCTKEDAMRPDDPPDLSAMSRIVPSQPINDVRRLHRAIFQVSWQTDTPMPLCSGEGQEIRPLGPGAQLVTVTLPGLISQCAVFPTLPVRDKRWEEYLKPTPCLQSNDPKVQALAAELVGSEKNPMEIAKRIEQGVQSRIRPTRRHSFLSAAEVAATLEGDSTENAVLAAAVARCLGLPSRVVTGLVYQERVGGTGQTAEADRGAFEFSMWTEVMVGPDLWWPLDAALGCFSAAHIAIRKSALNQADPSRDIGSEILMMIGTLNVEVVATEYQ